MSLDLHAISCMQTNFLLEQQWQHEHAQHLIQAEQPVKLVIGNLILHKKPISVVLQFPRFNKCHHLSSLLITV